MGAERKRYFPVIFPALVVILILIAGGYFLFPLGTLGLLFWICLAVLGQLWFINSQVKGFPYKCTGCGKVFFRSLFKEMLHFKSRRFNKFNCPDCKNHELK